MKEFDPTIFGFHRKRSLNHGLYFCFKEDGTYYTLNIINNGICEIYKVISSDSKWLIYQGLIHNNNYAKELFKNLRIID